LTHNTGSHHVEFFCLQVVERHVRNRHACTSDDNILSLRRILLSWMQDSTERKPFIGKKMAQIVALTFVIDYPQKWPAFFSDLLQCAGTGVQTSVELYLRVLLAIDEEVVDRQIIHTREESARNAVIKDTMRDHCAASLVDSWYQIMHRYEDICPALTNLAMEVVGTYISWIDITLIANDKFLQCLLHYLSVLALRESAAECLREIISKGMEPLPKIELVESLTKMLQSMHILSTASEEDTDAEFRMRLSALICGMGCALVNSWNKLLKRGNAMDIQVARTAIEEKLLYLHKYLNDEDDGVSEAMIPFAVQYLSVLKHCANLSDNDRANLQTLLHTVINKYKYDEDYNFLSQGEDEVTFLDYRKELKVLIDNIAMLDSSLVLQTTQSVLSSHLANLTTQPFMNVEVALRILYQVGEAITDKKFGACNIVGSPWHQMMTIVVQSNVAQHSHTAVLLQFYETIVRYEKFFTTESHYISGIMEVFLSEQGLRHSNCSVRSRVCYMFVRFVKGVRNQLGSIARDILNNLQELLVLLPDTKGNEGYLSGNDMMFLYEAAGILVVASLLPPEDKGLLMSQLLFPLVQKFPLYLEQLSKAEASSEQEETAQLLHHILSFASRASKVFTNHQMTVQNGCLDCFAEPLPVFLQGLEVSVQCSQLQAGVRQYLHRMIICLGDELLKYVPVAVSLLLKNCKSQEIQEFIPLINQLVAKYKERISPFLQDVFMPVVQTIVTCLGQPFDPNDSEAQRDHLSLQKCYFLFLNSLATNNVTEVIAKGANNLEEVLGTLVQGAVTFPDPTVQKVCFGVLRQIIDVWGTYVS
jgi:exportin-T